jgi:hypothetical protein
LEVLVPFNPLLSVTVNSNKYELAFTFPATVGAVNVAMDVFCPFSETGGASSSESSIPHA